MLFCRHCSHEEVPRPKATRRGWEVATLNSVRSCGQSKEDVLQQHPTRWRGGPSTGACHGSAGFVGDPNVKLAPTGASDYLRHLLARGRCRRANSVTARPLENSWRTASRVCDISRRLLMTKAHVHVGKMSHFQFRGSGISNDKRAKNKS